MCRQIEIDSKFLESQRIMDYSLLLGVHYRAPRHLRSLMSYSQQITADGLEIVAEEGTSTITMNDHLRSAAGKRKCLFA